MGIQATLKNRRVFFAPQHLTDGDTVQGIIDHVTANHGVWNLPPVLVVESEGNGDNVLDGHHRLEAAKRLGLAAIPAWVVTVPDYCKLLEAEFDGYCPIRMPDLWDFIECDGVLYSDIAN